MKKVFILCLIVAMGLGLTGATCLKNVQTTVCNAPADVVAQIQTVINLVELGISTFVPGSAPYVAAVGAFGTATSIQAGVCISLTQLNNLIAFLQSPDTQTLETKLMVKAGPMKATVVNIQPFINWRDKGK